MPHKPVKARFAGLGGHPHSSHMLRVSANSQGSLHLESMVWGGRLRTTVGRGSGCSSESQGRCRQVTDKVKRKQRKATDLVCLLQ